MARSQDALSRAFASALYGSALVLFLLGGCMLDRSGTMSTPPDAGAVVLDASRTELNLPEGMDAGRSVEVNAGRPMDAGASSEVDAGLDSGIDEDMDSGVDEDMDSGVDEDMDSGIDEDMDSRADERTDCEDRFGSLRRFELCEETATTCRFFVDPSGRASCAEVCGDRCLDGYDNDPGTCTEPPSSGDGCDVVRNDQVCICER